MGEHSKDQLLPDRYSDSAQPIAPIAGARTAWFIMVLLGVGSLMPWNAFITPLDYYRLRLRGSPFESSFESILTTSFTVLGMVTIIALQRVQHYVSLRARIYGSLVACVVIFVVVASLALGPLAMDDEHMHDALSHGATTQFALLVVTVAASGVAQAGD